MLKHIDVTQKSNGNNSKPNILEKDDTSDTANIYTMFHFVASGSGEQPIVVSISCDGFDLE